MIVLWLVLGIVGLSAWGAFLWVLLPRLSPVRAGRRASEEPLRGLVEALAVRMAALEASFKALPSEIAGLRDEAKRAADRATYHAGRLVEERTAREEDAWAAEGEGADVGDGDGSGSAPQGVLPLRASVDQPAGPTEREAIAQAQLMLLQGMH